VAAMMLALHEDPDLRARVIDAQRRRLLQDDIAQAEQRFLTWVGDRFAEGKPKAIHKKPPIPLRVRIEGPFETTYGLAVANRGLAEALEENTPHRVSIHCTEGTGDYVPRGRDLVDKPLARELWERSFVEERPDVLVRNTYPPRFDKLD